MVLAAKTSAIVQSSSVRAFHIQSLFLEVGLIDFSTVSFCHFFAWNSQQQIWCQDKERKITLKEKREEEKNCDFRLKQKAKQWD